MRPGGAPRTLSGQETGIHEKIDHSHRPPPRMALLLLLLVLLEPWPSFTLPEVHKRRPFLHCDSWAPCISAPPGLGRCVFFSRTRCNAAITDLGRRTCDRRGDRPAAPIGNRGAAPPVADTVAVTKICRDEFGIRHIFSLTLEDAAYAAGYLCTG